MIPCNVDINTQEILKLAETADPEGVRTMGVMTKPDLATEKATQKAVVDLLSGIRNPLKLGYHVVKNRGADDEDSTLHDRLADEKAFFKSSPWSSVADHCGIPALKLRLGDLLMQISRTEFPQVKGEIEAKLRHRRAEIEAMGPSRVDAIAQRQFLGNLAAKFQGLAQSAVGGHYDSDRAFTDDEELKLITKIIKLNESFSNVFAVHGHKYRFDRPAKDAREDYENAKYNGTENSDCGSDCGSDNQDHDEKESPLETQDEGIKRNDIVRATTVFKDCIKIYEKHSDEFLPLDTVCDSIDFFCPAPLESGIMKVIEQVYDTSRGPELGTVSYPLSSYFLFPHSACVFNSDLSIVLSLAAAFLPPCSGSSPRTGSPLRSPMPARPSSWCTTSSPACSTPSAPTQTPGSKCTSSSLSTGSSRRTSAPWTTPCSCSTSSGSAVR